MINNCFGIQKHGDDLDAIFTTFNHEKTKSGIVLTQEVWRSNFTTCFV